MKPILTNRAYDVLKWLCLIALPAASYLISKLGAIWGLPEAEQIVETVNAAAFFLGMLIGVSTAAYNKAAGK